MLTAIPRYGARVIPNTEQTIDATAAERPARARPAHRTRSSTAFAAQVGAGHAVTASYGRMAFYYLLQALRFPPGSEIILPALTFWVIPELARVAGLKPVFADVDPATFNLDPAAFERAITPRTRAVVPTHSYGLPCDMDAILHDRTAARPRRDRGLRARPRSDLARASPSARSGDAGFFSFQLLKPLNTYGGGMARHERRRPGVTRVGSWRGSEPSPSEARRAATAPTRTSPTHRHPARRVHGVALSRPLGEPRSFRPRRTCTCGRRSGPQPASRRRTEDATATCRRPSGSKPSSISMNGLRGPSSHAQALERCARGRGVETPRGAAAAGLTCSISTRSTRAIAMTSYDIACDVASTSKACTWTSARGCRSSATVTRPMPGAERAATAIQLPVYASLSPMTPFAGLRPSCGEAVTSSMILAGRSRTPPSTSPRSSRAKSSSLPRSVLVASGQLERWPVLVSGALGAATGDQMYFYALRGRIAGWLTRFQACRRTAGHHRRARAAVIAR